MFSARAPESLAITKLRETDSVLANLSQKRIASTSTIESRISAMSTD